MLQTICWMASIKLCQVCKALWTLLLLLSPRRCELCPVLCNVQCFSQGLNFLVLGTYVFIESAVMLSNFYINAGRTSGRRTTWCDIRFHAIQLFTCDTDIATWCVAQFGGMALPVCLLACHACIVGRFELEGRVKQHLG